MRVPSICASATRLGKGRISGRNVAAWAAALVLGSAAAVLAQEKDDKEEPPKPEPVLLATTADGVQLSATFYPGMKGKESVPVVLLHMWKHSSKDYGALAAYLQRTLGCAVLVPDLRGHGDSTRRRWAGRDETLNAATMLPAHFALMAAADMMAVKDFLWDKNNAEQLNLNKLCIVGAEMGASVALDFTRADWSIPPIGAHQLGQFVKALVLISPEWSFRGIQIGPAMAHPAVLREPSVMIVVGKGNAGALQDASRMHKLFERFHPEPPEDQKAEQQDLFFGRLDTSLQGTKLLEGKGLNLDKVIAQFIYLRLIKSDKARSAAYAWGMHKKNPYE